MGELVEFMVNGTNDGQRKNAPYDFVVVLHPNTCTRLGLKNYVVATRTADDAGNAPDRKKPLRVYGVVFRDDSLGKDEICLDQTLRNGLGIPYEQGQHRRLDLRLFPLRVSLFQRVRGAVTSWLGRRYLFLRIAKPYPPDIEKSICRASNDAPSLMGTDDGNRIVFVSCVKDEKDSDSYVLKNHSVKAFDLPDNMRAQRAKLEEQLSDEQWAARYVCAAKLLDVSPDIGWVFLDAHERKLLQVEPGDPIKVRRDFPDLLKRQLLEVGALLAISAIALTNLLPKWMKEDQRTPAGVTHWPAPVK